jgi:hypothetical protein
MGPRRRGFPTNIYEVLPHRRLRAGEPMSSLASLKHHAEENLNIPNGWGKFHSCKMKSCVENQIGEIILEA